MNKYILISISILLYSCGSGESNQSSSEGSGYCDCLHIPNEAEKLKVTEKYSSSGILTFKKYWDEKTQQVVEEKWDHRGNLEVRTTWKCFEWIWSQWSERIEYWPNGIIREHSKHDECGRSLKDVSYDKEGNLSSESIYHGVEDIYSFYQEVYGDSYEENKTKSELSLKTIYNEKGKLRDSINDLYPDVFPNKVGDWGTAGARIGREKRYTSYSKNGNIGLKQEYLYGELIGRQVNYNENNQLMSETNYIPAFYKGSFSSRVDGLSETYYKGVLQETSTTEYGTIVGYYFGESGQGFKDGPDFNSDYKEGNRIKEKHEEGELHVKSWFDGPVKFYCGDNRDPKRNLICEVNYIEGEPDGKFTALGCSGGDFSRTGYEVEFEYDNGKLLSKTVSDNGVIISKNVY